MKFDRTRQIGIMDSKDRQWNLLFGLTNNRSSSDKVKSKPYLLSSCFLSFPPTFFPSFFPSFLPCFLPCFLPFFLACLLACFLPSYPISVFFSLPLSLYLDIFHHYYEGHIPFPFHVYSHVYSPTTNGARGFLRFRLMTWLPATFIRHR